MGIEHVFLDTSSLAAGSIRPTLKAAIKHAHYLLPICTPRYLQRAHNESTNVYFEYDLILKKYAKNKNCVFPLLFDGDVESSVPRELRSILIRDFTHEDVIGYTHTLIASHHPIGLFAGMYGFHDSDPAYVQLVRQYRHAQLNNLKAVCKHFIPRDNIVEELEHNWSRTFIQCLSGSVGVGKTQIALAYAQFARARYHVIHCIDAINLDRAFRDISESLGLVSRGTPLENLIQNIYRELAAIRCLLIFFGVEDEASITLFLPQSADRFHVLITTRHNRWLPPKFFVTNIREFTEAEAMKYFRRLKVKYSQDTAKQLFAALGCAPSTLKWVATCMQLQALSLQNFLMLHRHEGTHAMSIDSLPIDHSDAPHRIIRVIIASLRTGNVAAFQLLVSLTFINNSGISREHLATLLEIDLGRLEAWLAYLGQSSLINFSDDEIRQISCNRLAQAIIREQGGLSEQQQRFEHVATQLLTQLTTCEQRGASPKHWLPHCHALLAHDVYVVRSGTGTVNMLKSHIIYAQALKAEQHQEWIVAIAQYEQAMGLGLVKAKTNLAKFYHKGLGVPQNLKLAFQLLFEAAHAGHARAMYNLAAAYATEMGTPKDLTAAQQWYQQALTAGYADAAKQLEKMLTSTA